MSDIPGQHTHIGIGGGGGSTPTSAFGIFIAISPFSVNNFFNKIA